MSGLTVYTGPMFSGKTESLIRAVKRAHYAALPTQVFVPASDTRNGIGVVRSHGGLDLESLGIGAWAVDSSDPVSLLDRVRAATRVVAIDEAQFFDAQVVGHVQALLRQNRQIYVSGLDRDYRGQPIGPMPQLLAIADSVIKLTAVCAGCCSDTATVTHRRTPQTEQVVLGAAEMYAPMCRVCYNAAT